MAGQKGSKAKGRKIGRNISKCAAYKSSGRREAHKARKVERDLMLKLRDDSKVSVNCLKKRNERRRIQEMPPNKRSTARMLASVAGDQQFGDAAKGHHIHQRDHHLATALTPKQFKVWEKAQKAQKSEVMREISEVT